MSALNGKPQSPLKPNPQAAQNYLRTRVLTATPEQLQMMLYDGALRFGEAARIALSQKDYEQTYNNVARVQKILTEFLSTLKHDVYPELCGKLAAIYKYVYKKLIEASVEHKMESMEEAINLLKFQRDTWAMLMDQLGKAKAGAAATKLAIPSPDARMEATISMSA
jgi:flagellar secretion chaperone FliS